jgi:hypothetical protein
MKHLTLLITLLFIGTLFVSVVPVGAQACDPSIPGIQCPLEPTADVGPTFVIRIINIVANWMFTILLVLTVVFIIIAAYKYLFSGGSEESVSSAHSMLLYAAVAVAVAMLSRGFVFVITKTVSSTATPGASAPASTGTTGDTTGSTTGSATASPSYSTITSFNVFNVRVQICKDNEIPGVFINSSDGQWSNFTNSNGSISTYGNPQIGPGPDGKRPTSMAANAGQFNLVGTVNTAILGLGALGLGTDYRFEVETCNNGQIPSIIYNRGSNSADWKQL